MGVSKRLIVPVGGSFSIWVGTLVLWSGRSMPGVCRAGSCCVHAELVDETPSVMRRMNQDHNTCAVKKEKPQRNYGREQPISPMGEARSDQDPHVEKKEHQKNASRLEGEIFVDLQ